MNRSPKGGLIIDDPYYEMSGLFFYGNRDALIETAAQVVAPTPEAPAVLHGAQEAIGAAHQAAPAPPAARHGRSLLRQAVLRRH